MGYIVASIEHYHFRFTNARHFKPIRRYITIETGKTLSSRESKFSYIKGIEAFEKGGEAMNDYHRHHKLPPTNNFCEGQRGGHYGKHLFSAESKRRKDSNF